jgi:osmoprotectant transport system ATP-binding protein
VRVLIELRAVTKEYRDGPAVRNLSLEFPEGKTTALIGPSGCGKSTILRLILGLVLPTSGEVLFEGKRVTRESEIQVRRSVGYVIQDGGLFPHLTSRENITLMARHLNGSASESDVRIKELLALTHLASEAMDRYPGELSGGQRQRVGLMRALMLEPKALLLDEPLGALDPMVRAGLQTELKGIFQQLGQTVVLVTHDMGEAAYLGDQIVLMRAGEIVQQGSLEDFQKRPADPFVTEFMNAQRGMVSL